ncbi:dynamin family protein [Leifsonia sp. YIM 134122]|uniref:Dynamin family protein n=1 Tax=Leifsonia stereocauli TaxID=3134136 RepID=A0ABU9W0G1_9MICO
MTAQHDPLTEAILAVCDRYDDVGGPEVAPATSYARARLTEPLRVAVVGRVKAGKSTLVNAIIGRKVAATADVECTKVVTQYRFGADEGATLHLSGGRPHIRVPLQDGMLPDRLPVPVDQISYAVVKLSSEPLRNLTLIDTPGLETTSAELEVVSRQSILGVGGVRQADAIIYLFRGKELADDVDFLREFRNVAGDVSSSGAIGVLSHADRYGSGPWGDDDSLVEATDRAAEMQLEHASDLAAVIPVAGRLAETAVTGVFTESHARTLARLRGLSEFQLQARENLDGVTIADVRQLSMLVGEYGLRYGREIAGGGASPVIDWMWEKSGVDQLHTLMRRHYVNRIPQLKAKQAMEQLERAAHNFSQRMPLRRMLSDARLAPALHPLEEVRAWELLSARPDEHELLGLVNRLLRGNTDQERVGLPPAADAAAVRTAALSAGDVVKQHLLAGDPSVTKSAAILTRSFAAINHRNSS